MTPLDILLIIAGFVLLNWFWTRPTHCAPATKF